MTLEISKTREPVRNGFTLLEAVIVMFLIAVLTVSLLPFLSQMNDTSKSVRAADEVGRIYAAIVGNPARGSYGYLGDVGRYPETIMDLVRSNGLAGWDGPYLSGVSVSNNAVVDPFGNPYEYYFKTFSTELGEGLVIISKGPDGRSSNGSATPNFYLYSGTPDPSDATYADYSVLEDVVTAYPNRDNIVHPQFTHHADLLRYNGVGTLNINVMNFDNNPSVAALVPACPNRYEVKVTSATRSTDTWGTETAGTTPAYTPGGGSFDLIQGVYKVQVRLGTSPYPVVFDETLAITPGANQSRTIQVPGVDSSTTSTYTLTIQNSLGAQIDIYNGSTLLGSAADGMSSGPLSVRGCAQVSVRYNGTGELVDSFAMPIGLATHTKNYTAPYTYSLTNNKGDHRYLFVYRNNLLIGEVSGWGIRKVKTFPVRDGDEIIVRNQSGFEPLSPITIDNNLGNTL